MPEWSVLGVLEHPWTSIWMSWDSHGCLFWGSRGIPRRVRRAVVAKDPLHLSAYPRLEWFWRLKRAPKGAKIESKSVKNRFNNRLIFLLDFWKVFGAFLVDFGRVSGTLGPQNECLAYAACYFAEDHVFQTRFGFGMMFD